MRRLLPLLLTLVLAACTARNESVEDPGPKTRATGPHEVSCRDLDRYIARTERGYVPVRSPDLSLIPHEPNYVGVPYDAVHAGPFDYLARVPLFFYGPGYVDARGRIDESPRMTDVAPTIGRLIGYRFDAPDGRAITTALDPDPQAPPRLVVTMVWDGGGWDTLRQHPRSWPYLKHLMTQGVVYGGMEIGSTPSDTPPIHTTLGTGAYPEHHGIPHVKMQTASGDYIDPFEDNSPKYIRLPTLGDVYDRAEGGRPIVGVVATVNWHLGMIGHGALYPNGDRDIAVLLNSGGYTYGDPSIYDIPSELSDPALLDRDAAALDGRDGARDGVWRGHSLEELDVRYASPAFVDFQESVLERTITTQGFGSDAVPDLLYTNFKSIDDSGHHWGQTSPEMGDAIAATDDALKQVVTFLNSRVGKRRWVLIVTADHGTAKLPEESGGWAIRGHDLEADLNRAFDRDEDDTTLIERVNSAGIYIDRDELTHGDHEIEQIGRWLLNYTAADNLYGISRIPTYYEDKADVPLFDAVMDGRKVIARSCD